MTDTDYAALLLDLRDPDGHFDGDVAADAIETLLREQDAANARIAKLESTINFALLGIDSAQSFGEWSDVTKVQVELRNALGAKEKP